MACNALIKAILPENPERCGQSALHVLPLLVLVTEDWRSGKVDSALCCEILLDSGFERHFAIVYRLGFTIRIGGVRSHC